MRRGGYTLAEALIALAVVGIIAAVMLPLISKYKPDTYKVLYLRTYDAISRSIAEFSSNERMYPEWNGDPKASNGDDIRYFDYPFFNIGKIKLDNGKTVEDKHKLCELLALSAGAKEYNCKDEYLPYTGGALSPSFEYKNGVEVLVTTDREIKSDDTARYRTEIFFDVDGKDKGPNCLYNSVSCKEPDTFKLIIGADGTVVPGDAYGYEYRKKRSSWKKQEMVVGEVPDFDDRIKLKRWCNLTENMNTAFCKCFKTKGFAEDSKECICDVMGDTQNPICKVDPPLDPPEPPTPEELCSRLNDYNYNGENSYEWFAEAQACILTTCRHIDQNGWSFGPNTYGCYRNDCYPKDDDPELWFGADIPFKPASIPFICRSYTGLGNTQMMVTEEFPTQEVFIDPEYLIDLRNSAHITDEQYNKLDSLYNELMKKYGEK